jgi:hypothetical protein
MQFSVSSAFLRCSAFMKRSLHSRGNRPTERDAVAALAEGLPPARTLACSPRRADFPKFQPPVSTGGHSVASTKSCPHTGIVSGAGS